MKDKSAILAIAILSLSVLGTEAWAQNEQPQVDTTIEEVVVTATKRTASIQDVPVAVTVLDEDALDDAGAVDLKSLVNMTPTLNVFSSASTAQTSFISIRGVGTLGNNVGLESAVGTFIDGVYQPRPGIAMSEFVDMKQVEVLRGPQGTLFGRNTSAGALVLRSNEPNMDETSGSVELTAGNENLANVKGMVNIAANDELAFRFAGSYRSRDGLYDNPTTGKDAHDIDRFMVRGQALWQPNDEVSVRFVADYAESDELCCQGGIEVGSPFTPFFSLASIPGGGAAVTGESALDKRLFNGDPRREGTDHLGISAELNWEFENSTLTFISAYRDFEAISSGDADSVNTDFFAVPGSSPNVTGVESFTLEARLQGEAGKLDWLVGAFYGDEEVRNDFTLAMGPDADAHLNAFYFGVLAGATGDPLALGPSPILAFTQGNSINGAFNRNEGTQDSKSFSIFTHNIFNVTDRFSITLGLRYVDEEKDGGIAVLGGESAACGGVLTNPALAPGGPLAGFAPLAFGLICNGLYAPQLSNGFTTDFEDDALTYTASGSYNLADNMSVYASYTKGFKSGGINLELGANPADPTFDSEDVEAYEIGFKSTFFDNKVVLNIALFDQDIEDFQLNTFDGIRLAILSVPNAESSGAEVELRADLADWLTVNTAVSYYDASYPSDCDGGVVNTTITPLCGTDLPNAPEVGAFLGLNTHFVIANGMALRMVANFRYADESLPSPINPTAYQDSTTMVDVRAALMSADERWSVELWGKNITDEFRHTRGKFPIPFQGGGSISYLTDPKTYGVTFRMGF